MRVSTCKVSKENGYTVKKLADVEKWLPSHPGLSDEKSEDYIKTTCTSSGHNQNMYKVSNESRAVPQTRYQLYIHFDSSNA